MDNLKPAALVRVFCKGVLAFLFVKIMGQNLDQKIRRSDMNNILAKVGFWTDPLRLESLRSNGRQQPIQPYPTQSVLTLTS